MIKDSARFKTVPVEDTESSELEPLVIGFTMLFHPMTSRIGEVAQMVAAGSGERFELNRMAPDFGTPFGEGTGPLHTTFVSRTPIELHATGDGGLSLRRHASINLTVNGAPSELEHRFDGRALRRGVVLVLGDAVVLLLHLLDPGVTPHRDNLGMIGRSAEMERLRSEILKVADLDTRVLIRGQSGTGKELVASAIQANSHRREQPFERVNITEIPTAIAERELFGAAKHAGTMEPGHQGYFLRADKGTLFLDEVGNVDPAVQPKLLRAVETGEIQVLGANTKSEVDVRVLAGTDVDLEHAVETGQFKSSLLQRLAAYTIHLPPLMDRRADIGRLFVHFLEQELEVLGETEKLAEPEPGKRPWLPASFVAKLALCGWPGNVRQLKNVAARVAIINRGSSEFLRDERIDKMLEADVVDHSLGSARPGGEQKRHRHELEALSDEEIVGHLEDNGFNISRTARSLRVERAMFYRDLKRRNIDVEALRSEWTTRCS